MKGPPISKLDYAGLGQRVVALSIDVIVIVIFNFFSNKFPYPPLMTTGVSDFNATVLFALVYFFLFSLTGARATPGKKMAGIFIAAESGQNVSPISLLLRVSLQFAVFLIYMLLIRFIAHYYFNFWNSNHPMIVIMNWVVPVALYVLSIVTTHHKQALHDIGAKTVVLKKRNMHWLLYIFPIILVIPYILIFSVKTPLPPTSQTMFPQSSHRH